MRAKTADVNLNYYLVFNSKDENLGLYIRFIQALYKIIQSML